MGLYSLMKEYVEDHRIAFDNDSLTPELGHTLSLFHSCLLEAGMDRVEDVDLAQVISSPQELTPNHLSHFIVGHLPFNSINTKKEINSILFDVYSFLRWLEKKNIPHGLQGSKFEPLVKSLSDDQERCLQLSHLLDEESGRTLDDPPHVIETASGFFSVVKMDGATVYLKTKYMDHPIRLKLRPSIVKWMHLGDWLELVLGDTTNKWVILEAGMVYPDVSDSPPSG